LKSKETTIKETLLDNFFGIDADDFSMRTNSPTEILKPPGAFYEFTYPETRGTDGYGYLEIELEDGEKIPIKYVVKFRGRDSDKHPEDGLERGSLPAKRRGARVYCNKRLAAGPTLFDLPTGMHNFHSQSYMECIVHADDLDRQNVDLVNTNRSDLRRDNDIVDKVVFEITEIMRKSLGEHSKFRDKKAEKDLADSEISAPLMKIIEQMPRSQGSAARQVLRSLASMDGTESETFKETAPLVLLSMNAGGVLIRLMELGHDPESLPIIAEQLTKLSTVERNDALKLYKGRRNGILALRKLLERGEDEWKGSKFEAELHLLLKKNPWLIRPEYTRYLTSDQPVAQMAKSLSKELKVDSYAGTAPDPDKRPDLVFLLQDSIEVHTLVIVEIKSPNIPLNQDHSSQLVRYIEQAKVIAKAEVSREIRVRGYLIGSMPDAMTKNPAELVILSQYAEKRANEAYEILTLRDMLERAWTIHIEGINVLEAAEDEDAAVQAQLIVAAPQAAIAAAAVPAAAPAAPAPAPGPGPGPAPAAKTTP
jgi:hypothetical protein